jgi:Flp pilus assembly protein TadD
LAPEDKKALYGLSRAFTKLGRRDEAARIMQQFEARDTRDFEDHKSRLRLYDDQDSIRQVLARTLIGAGRIYRQHQRVAEAEDALRRARRLQPGDTESRNELIGLYDQTGDDKKALVVSLELLAIDPDNAEAWLSVGVLKARQGDLEGGLRAVRRAMEIDPENSRFREVCDLLEKGS